MNDPLGRFLLENSGLSGAVPVDHPNRFVLVMSERLPEKKLCELVVEFYTRRNCQPLIVSETLACCRVDVYRNQELMREVTLTLIPNQLSVEIKVLSNACEVASFPFFLGERISGMGLSLEIVEFKSDKVKAKITGTNQHWVIVGLKSGGEILLRRQVGGWAIERMVVNKLVEMNIMIKVHYDGYKEIAMVSSS